MKLSRQIKRRVSRAFGKEKPDTRLYVALPYWSLMRIAGSRIGLNRSETAELFLKLGLASFRSRAPGEVKQLIEDLVGPDYLVRFRKSGVEGLGFQPRLDKRD